MDNTNAANTTTATVGSVDDFAEGTMKMTSVGTRRIVVIRTASGIHALDNACPHQGYGMATGALDGELLTCQWHNWKFDVRDGSCVRGEEAIPCHAVSIEDDQVVVSVTEPSNEEQRATLWRSLRTGMERNYVGQVARDTARLLHAEASPAEIMGDAIAYGAPRNEWGVGHEMAQAADLLAWAEIRTGDEAALPLVHGLAGISEVSRDRPARPVPAPDATIDFGQAIEAEDIEGAMSATMAAINEGRDPAAIRHDFIDAVSQHHLGYGHGIIYTQKAFELLDRVGWQLAPDLLPHLAASVGWATREDVLPYMRKAMRSITDADLGAMVEADDRTVTGWNETSALADRLSAATDAPIETAVEAVLHGAGVEGLLDAITLGASRRLLRHDLDIEFDHEEDFGWLDITHALTMSRAARWAWEVDPGPQSARIALFATWLLFDSGRAERRHGAGPSAAATSTPSDFATAVRMKDVGGALAWMEEADRTDAVDAMITAALDDQAGSFIVSAHVIKLAQAAAEEATTIDSIEPVLATTRFIAAPRLERFVSANVASSLDFVRTGNPPKR